MPDRPLFHTVLEAEMHLCAPPSQVFPLLCPVRETEWLPGWSAEVLHSRSGLAETGCVFRTRDEDGRERVWTVTRHDAAAGAVQFVQLVAGVAVIRLDIALHPEGSGTRAVWTYTVAALAAGHDGFFAAYGAAAFRARMERLEGYLETFLRRAG